MASPRLLPPANVRDIFDLLAAFTPELVDTLAEHVHAASSFFLEPEATEALAERHQVSEDDLRYVLGTLSVLHNRLSPSQPSADEVAALAQTAVESEYRAGDEAPADLPSRLTRLLTAVERDEGREKVGRLQRGFLPNLVGISSFMDLRPVYADEDARISGFVPVMQIELRSDSRKAYERTMICHVDSKNLDRMIDELQRLKKKFETVTSEEHVSELIMST